MRGLVSFHSNFLASQLLFVLNYTVLDSVHSTLNCMGALRLRPPARLDPFPAYPFWPLLIWLRCPLGHSITPFAAFHLAHVLCALRRHLNQAARFRLPISPTWVNIITRKIPGGTFPLTSHNKFFEWQLRWSRIPPFSSFQWHAFFGAPNLPSLLPSWALFIILCFPAGVTLPVRGFPNRWLSTVSS